MIVDESYYIQVMTWVPELGALVLSEAHHYPDYRTVLYAYGNWYKDESRVQELDAYYAENSWHTESIYLESTEGTALYTMDELQEVVMLVGGYLHSKEGGTL